MTSEWDRQNVDGLVEEILTDVRQVDSEHHFGLPYMTAYQLAIKLHQQHREVADALNTEVGGRGTGSHTSLAQYLARELSRRIKDSDGTYRVEGAFLSNDGVTGLSFANPDGGDIESSLTGGRKDLSLFRFRAQES